MTVFVVGAHGQIGQMVTAKLHQAGQDVIAGIRDSEQAALFTKIGVKSRQFDLLDLPETMAAAFSDCDTVIFTACSGGKTGYDGTLNIDLDGAVKTMTAAKLAGVKHYLMVSAMGTADRTFWPQSGIRPYYVAKYYADEWLINRSQLNYTILRPGALTNDPATGLVTVDPDKSAGKSITREDVAEVLVQLVIKPANEKIITVVNGATPILKALA
ncbi:SDR family oxidoreductase [Loigolactobacillus backii]|uniref:SDR family oxidoreductase n=1 Tax=Loigolactobacillus backii TaxID=375175 RepID=UPI0022FD7B86|nr:SDR family oxidoreductase [Loigolactobacillus backii]MDA5388396.1 SDR family oxidoreductase [Loigolactobacillus backii]MDA5390893.1 SDR family oxidoreductase [Loigolactobacillus backii]